MDINQETIQNIVKDVLSKLSQSKTNSAPVQEAPASFSCGCSSNNNGIFKDANEACEAAYKAYEQLRDKGGILARKTIVQIIRDITIANMNQWGSYEYNETKIGRLKDKPGKLSLVSKVPGVEWLSPRAYSGDDGITMEEYTPFGVVGAITPLTHSIPTIAGNIISMVSSGNAIVFNAHPGGVKSAILAITAYNKEIEKQTGIKNLITCIEKPTLESFNAICKNDKVGILSITGGPGVVDAALKSGKRAICAGPGNPPAVVDETCDVENAAKSIVAGGGFDNNLLCIGEKEVFVVESIFDEFIDAFKRAKAMQVSSEQLEILTKEAFPLKDGKHVLNRKLVGASVQKLGEVMGINVPEDVEILFAQTNADHLFVFEEQMMPFLPVVKCKNFEEAIIQAKKAERNFKHSAIIHSRNVDRMTIMAKLMNTTIFVKNGPSTAGLALGGEGYLSYSIATTTGEGITNPQTFTRTRRCTMVEALNIF